MAALPLPSARRRLCALVVMAVAAVSGGDPAWAVEDVYLTTDAFVASVFTGERPAAGKLENSDELGWRLADALGHVTRAKRFRYWRSGARSAWVLEEIGKERPITIGVAVEGGRVLAVRVLTYRETHGHEVADPAHTKRYEGAALAADDRLDRDIDNITGATLSARAMTRVARAALVLDDWVHRHEDLPAP